MLANVILLSLSSPNPPCIQSAVYPETLVQKVGKTMSLFLASVSQPTASEELEEFGARSKGEICCPSRLESIAQTRMKGRVGEEARRGRTHWWVSSSGSCSPATSSDCVGMVGERGAYTFTGRVVPK